MNTKIIKKYIEEYLQDCVNWSLSSDTASIISSEPLKNACSECEIRQVLFDMWLSGVIALNGDDFVLMPDNSTIISASEWSHASIEHYINSLQHEVTEVRLFRDDPYLVEDSGKRTYVGKTLSGFFDNSADIQKAVEPYLNDEETHAIYITLQACDPRLFARAANKLIQAKSTTKDNDIINWHVFPIDIDPNRPEGISTTDQEVLDARKVASEIQYWLLKYNIPSYLAMSGNGWHVLVYLVPEVKTEENTVLIKELGDRIDNRWDTDVKVYNPARLLKLYGTVARKGSDTKERPHRKSRIKLPDNLDEIKRVTLQELTKVIKQLPLPNKQVTNGPITNVRVSNKQKRFHGSSSREWQLYAQQVLGVKEIEDWKGKGQYQLARCTCPFCNREQHAFITYSNTGAPGIRCHSNTCNGKSLEDLYLERGIEKSKGSSYRKKRNFLPTKNESKRLERFQRKQDEKAKRNGEKREEG